MRISLIIIGIVAACVCSCTKNELEDLTLVDNMFHPSNGDFMHIDSASRESISFGNAIFTIYGHAELADAIQLTDLVFVVRKQSTQIYSMNCDNGGCTFDGNGHLSINSQENTFAYQVTLVNYSQDFYFEMYLQKNGKRFTNKSSIIVPY
ncbi:hypothetical protein [Parvicella tangerina]|uniref:Uncharacterized protein n=1 Tax=Parvicella tangerina TaxID=2829795 RepID=A0A916NS10_9FLAO|nr:hypothetical protein [Parvicella tangerina]CAG5082680.1 hypothetical protein CRYO30217_01981 [Parvicella tangerina]